MDEAAGLLKNLIQTSIQATDQQRRRLEELIAKDFPAKHAKQLLNAILEFNNEEKFTSVFGYDVSLADRGFADLDIGAEEGRMFLPGDRNVMLIGHNIAFDGFDKKVKC